MPTPCGSLLSAGPGRSTPAAQRPSMARAGCSASTPTAQRPSMAWVERLPRRHSNEASIPPGRSRCLISVGFPQDWGTLAGLRGLGATICRCRFHHLCDRATVNFHFTLLLDRMFLLRVETGWIKGLQHPHLSLSKTGRRNHVHLKIREY
uniref:Uncharacterized protein n=1 Tax=Myotis myotis TaxID=51298 RepID=A0A7J8AMC4_MYOMY|nr:hypothetical protein mMyoMyo1_007891 [Myotis myotis]